MKRGTVIRIGDPRFSDAIADGMAAAKLQREIEALKIREAYLGVHDVAWRKKIAQKIRRAERYYGKNPRIPKIARRILGIYGLIVWTIHSLAERLKAKNREVGS